MNIELWGLACAAALLAASGLSLALNISKKYANRGNIAFDVLSKMHPLFIAVFSLYAGSLFLEMPESLQDWPYRFFLCALAIQGGVFGNEMVFYFLKRSNLFGLDEETIVSGSIAAINFVTKSVIWSLVAIFLLGNLGFNVTALLTGLGVGGIAIALAVQNVLSDLFASFSIIVDKPFRIGDLIVVDDHKGHVENIGLKTTRIRSVNGEQLIFSNADLLKSRIRNFEEMKKRRVSFQIGVKMTTPLDVVEAIPQMLKETIQKVKNVEFLRAYFKEITDFAYQFEVVYFVETPDGETYLLAQQEINLKILRLFEKEGIEMPYPTSTVHLTHPIKP